MRGAPRGGTVARRPGRRGVAVLVVLAAAVGLGWLLVRGFREGVAARAALPMEEGRLSVAGISERVEIYRDALGVPHVQATNEADAHFGWGFAHAQDRLAQMLWLRRSARGRTAEILGREGLPADRWARVLGLGALADAQYERLDAPSRDGLVAYAAGVNARIERIRAGRVGPPLVLGEPPADPWLPADSLAVLKLYSWGLSDTIDVSLVLRDINERLGSRAAAPFFPRGGGGWSSPGPPPAVTAAVQPGASAAAVPGLARLRRALGLDGRSVGSSAWLVGGAATESGHALLAGDTHLEPTAPSLLHVAHVHGGRFDAAGVAVPGVPAFWTGHNESVAWASTHPKLASIDLYEETIDPEDPGRYHDGRGWQPLRERVEVISIRGGGEERLTIRSSRHGPLIDGLLPHQTEPLALAWIGGRDDFHSAMTTLSRIARAADADELLDALEQHHEPPLALVYADSEGAGGLQVAGWIPRRELRTDLVPLPGRARWYDWKERIPFDQLPRRVLINGRGTVIAADGRLPSPGDAEPIEWLWRSGVRAKRIDALLARERERGAIDLRRMSRLQADVGSQRAAGLIEAALEVAGPIEQLAVEAQDVTRLLEQWDGESREDSVGAAAYHVFVESLAGALFERAIGKELGQRFRALPQVDIGQVVLALLANGGREEVASDVAGEVVRESLRRTWLDLSFRLGANQAKWRWGLLHRLSFRPFGWQQRGAATAELSDLPFGGSGDTVNAAEFVGPESLSVRVASTFRIVLDLGSLDQALIAFAPGESEHPQHPHHWDAVEGWRAGRSALLVTDHVQVRESGSRRLVLERLP